MNYEKIIIIKRNGAQEPFALGRIALAVYKAASAHQPPILQSKARALGAQIGQDIQKAIRSGATGSSVVELEWIQDQVVFGLKNSGEVDLANTYQAYREARSIARQTLRAQKEREKRWRFVESHQRLDFTHAQWLRVLDEAIERGPKREWDALAWWEAAKDRATPATHYNHFVGAHIEALIHHCDGRAHWMGAASALLLERWTKSTLGSGLLSDGAAKTNLIFIEKAKQHLKKIEKAPHKESSLGPHNAQTAADSRSLGELCHGKVTGVAHGLLHLAQGSEGSGSSEGQQRGPSKDAISHDEQHALHLKEQGWDAFMSDSSELKNHETPNWMGQSKKALREHEEKLGSSDAFEEIFEQMDLNKDCQLGFQGLCLLERLLPKWEHGVELPSLAFARASIALAKRDTESQSDATEAQKFRAELFKAFSNTQLLLPLSSLKSALYPDQSFIQEWALGIDDDLESIFETLKETASAGKSGGSVVVDLTPIRAEGRSIGAGTRTSAGLRPVLALFGEACGMLEAAPGERQKARLFLEPWHSDLETFLAYGKIAPPEIRLGLSLPDAFMRRVIEGGDWILASPTEVPFLAKTKGGEFEEWVKEYTQMVRVSGLEKAKRVEARQVFEWICDSIQSTGGPSIAFKDQLTIFGAPSSQKNCLSTRMSSLLPLIQGQKSGVPEAALNASLISSDEEGERLARLALRALKSANIQACEESGPRMKWCQDNQPIALTVVGKTTPQKFSGWVLAAAQDLGVGQWAKGALWNEARPWNESRQQLLTKRGGMLEPLKELETEDPLNSVPPFASLISMNAREEYLWLSGQPPSFVDGASYKAQARFGQAKVVFGSAMAPGNVKKQAQVASAWQAHCDQGITWDARVERLNSKFIGEAIKLAWLHGLSGVRRFLGPTAGSID